MSLSPCGDSGDVPVSRQSGQLVLCLWARSEMLLFQWAEPIIQPVENDKNINRHPSCDESGYPLRGFDYTGPPCYKTEEI